MDLSMASISFSMDSTRMEFCAVETRLARPSPTNFNDTANVQPLKRKSSSSFEGIFGDLMQGGEVARLGSTVRN
jgi:hypothetical protein